MKIKDLKEVLEDFDDNKLVTWFTGKSRQDDSGRDIYSANNVIGLVKTDDGHCMLIIEKLLSE